MKKTGIVKRRISCFLIVVLLCVNFANVTAEEESNIAAFSENALSESVTLLENLFSADLLEKGNEEPVTRAEFVDGTLKLLQIPAINKEESVYSDITEENKYFDSVNTAYELGIIAQGNKFNPDDIITVPQAVKILVHAVKRQKEAETAGYPNGYLKVAYQMELLKGISYSEISKVNGGTAKVLFYNLLNAKAYTISVFSLNNTSYALGPETYLETIYGVAYFEGVITSTGYSSLVMDDPIRKNKICVDGIEYDSKPLESKMLGKKSRVYFYKDEGNICCVTEKKGANQEISFLAQDYEEINGNTLKYSEGTSYKRVLLDSAYKVIYNGRRVSKLQNYMLDDIGAQVRLLNNNSDSGYDIIFIDGYKYGYVTGVSILDRKIGIKLPGSSIDLQDEDERLINIYDGNKNKIELFELENNSIVAVKMSDDMFICDVIICNERVSGTISKIEQDYNIIGLTSTEYIETREFDSRYEEVEKEYKYSNDFAAENMTMLRVGDTLNAVLGVHSEIVYLNSNEIAGSKYGYYLEVKSKRGGDEIYAKILSTACQFEMLNFAKKVTIDGKGGYNPDTAYTYLTTVAPQVVKYTLNDEGEIRILDFASTDTSNFAKHISDSKNNLVRYYSHTDAKLTYRSACRGFNNVALLGTATLLIVPNGVANLDDITNFKTGNYSQLISGTSYAVDIYNVDEYGMAEFAVIYYDITSPIGMRTTKSCIVEKVLTSYNEEEDEVGRTVSCWCEDKFYTYFLPNDVTVSKTSGAGLCSGDIIRIEVTESGVIKRIAVDYDFSTGTPVFDSSGGASHSETGESNLGFTEGKLFSQSTTSFMISSKLKAGTAYDYSYVNLRPYYATSIIALYDTSTRKVRSITKGELHDYQGYGNLNDFIVVRQDYGASKVVYAFRY